MGTPLTLARGRRSATEEGAAVVRVVMAVTAATGAMLGMLQVADDTPPIILVPSVLLLAALVRGAEPAAAWFATAVWAVMLPLADGIAIFAPILMVAICGAIAIGPDRAVAWIRDDWAGHEAEPPAPAGWIEEDPGRPPLGPWAS